MNLGQIKTELQMILRDPYVEASFDTWVNDELSQLSYEFDFPGLRLKLPATMQTVATRWQYDLHEAFHPQGYQFQKKLFKVASASIPAGMPIEHDLQLLDQIDPQHTETGTDVQRVAYELDGHDTAILGTWPMAEDSLSLWFFRKPALLTQDAHVPDFLPDEHVFDVLVPRVVLRSFRVYPELGSEVVGDNTRALQLWTQRYQAGLYGDGYSIGLLQSLRKSNPPRIRGPRPGGNLAGGDHFRGGWGGRLRG